ncbi:MAG: hypothetical protein AAFX94_15200 [Myxococcota bacterium]
MHSKSPLALGEIPRFLSEVTHADTVGELIGSMEQALSHAEADNHDWRSLLDRLQIRQPRPSEEQLALACGFRPTHGAPPAEVRVVLTELADSVSLADEDRDRLVEHLHRRYLRAIRPKSSLGGIFANAAATSLLGGVAADRVETLRCERCGAGRQKESEMQVCGFCGHRFSEQL